MIVAPARPSARMLSMRVPAKATQVTSTHRYRKFKASWPISESHRFGKTIAAISAIRGHGTPASSTAHAVVMIATAIHAAVWWKIGMVSAYAVEIVTTPRSGTAIATARRTQRKPSVSENARASRISGATGGFVGAPGGDDATHTAGDDMR